MKKKISKAIKELEKAGFKVFNFSSNKRLNIGMRDFVDYVVITRNIVWFLELKIGTDKMNAGQNDTYYRLQVMAPQGAIRYRIITEKNYKAMIDDIVRHG